LMLLLVGKHPAVPTYECHDRLAILRFSFWRS
jgi:hypothetical protein